MNRIFFTSRVNRQSTQKSEILIIIIIIISSKANTPTTSELGYAV